jgi:hypothetical protein
MRWRNPQLITDFISPLCFLFFHGTKVTKSVTFHWAAAVPTAEQRETICFRHFQGSDTLARTELVDVLACRNRGGGGLRRRLEKLVSGCRMELPDRKSNLGLTECEAGVLSDVLLSCVRCREQSLPGSPLCPVSDKSNCKWLELPSYHTHTRTHTPAHTHTHTNKGAEFPGPFRRGD